MMGDNALKERNVKLDVEPLDALVDEPVHITLSGLNAGQVVMLSARTYDMREQVWASSATFVADNRGVVDISAQAPKAGSYRQVDPMGLFWSMRPMGKRASTFFTTGALKPVIITLSAVVNGREVAAAHLTRRFATEDVIHMHVREQGLVGVFCYPARSGPVPALIVLPGSDGHVCENQAALLASRGFAALALAYFGTEGLPKNLVNIPLEYFGTALQWLQARTEVDGERMGAIGLSRGGELVLLLGATFPAIKAVVACSPSGLVQAGLDRRRFASPAWTYRGKPLQHVKVRFTPVLSFKLMWQSFKAQSFPMRDIFLTTLKDYEHLEAATIPVENTQGPILLISGGDDKMWPASIFAERVMQRLREQHHPFVDRHLCYKGAGHFVSFPYGYPYLPPCIKQVQGLAVGGTLEATAASVRDSWQEILVFFRRSFGSR
jgi:acetyl esterase/lipase